MKHTWQNTPAYQGRGWKARRAAFREERGLWSPWRVNSEWSRLEAVVLYAPRLELRAIRDPKRVQHLRPVILPQLQREYKAVAQVYRRLGIQTLVLDPALLPKPMRAAPPNLMFVRDLFFNTPEGCVISRMASRVRAGEEKFATAALAAAGLPIRSTIAGRGLFEGADALWLDSTTVLCGVGARTNKEGFLQLKRLLHQQGVIVAPVRMPRGVQHLLGLLKITGPQTAVVRTKIAPPALMRLLRGRGFQIAALNETPEVLERQAMNFVTVDRNRIVMAAGCPDVRAQLESAGIKTVAEVEISQLCNAAGGLGCATGILGRRLLK
jgi:N-dimethylarginine dimethylaminohydrolase